MAVVPDRKTFLEKAKQGNLVPVWKEVLADQETPVSAYERVRSYLRQRDNASHTYLLESVEGGENIGRYSFIGGTPRTILRAYGRRVEIATVGEEPRVIEDIDPLDALKNHMAQFAPVVDDPSLPRFIGGAVGFLGYDMVSQFEPRIPVIGNDEIGNPDMVFMVTDGLIVFDRVNHNLKIVANAHIDGDPNEAYDKALAQIDELCDALRTPIERVLFYRHCVVEPLAPKSNTTREEFLEMVGKVQEYIHSGDVIQTVISQRFEVAFLGALRRQRWPSPSSMASGSRPSNTSTSGATSTGRTSPSRRAASSTTSTAAIPRRGVAKGRRVRSERSSGSCCGWGPCGWARAVSPSTSPQASQWPSSLSRICVLETGSCTHRKCPLLGPVPDVPSPMYPLNSLGVSHSPHAYGALR